MRYTHLGFIKKQMLTRLGSVWVCQMVSWITYGLSVPQGFMCYKVGLSWDSVKRCQKVKKWDYLVVVVVFWTQRIALRGTEVVLMGTESVLERNAVKKSLATPYPLWLILHGISAFCMCSHQDVILHEVLYHVLIWLRPNWLLQSQHYTI